MKLTVDVERVDDSAYYASCNRPVDSKTTMIIPNSSNAKEVCPLVKEHLSRKWKNQIAITIDFVGDSVLLGKWGNLGIRTSVSAWALSNTFPQLPTLHLGAPLHPRFSRVLSVLFFFSFSRFFLDQISG